MPSDSERCRGGERKGEGKEDDEGFELLDKVQVTTRYHGGEMEVNGGFMKHGCAIRAGLVLNRITSHTIGITRGESKDFRAKRSRIGTRQNRTLPSSGKDKHTRHVL